ncbi:MAG: prepilin peptidase [Chloroflexi bacterium]|nr:prepilin peptidase [Chloroflexota bacterium]
MTAALVSGGLVFLFGAALGSFLNVVIDRIPAGRSLLSPPSHCDSCQRRLGVLELVPILSYLALRGRCRHCGAAIPRRILLVELGTGAMLLWLWAILGLGPLFLRAAFCWSALLVLSIIDLKTGLLPDRIIFPVSAVALITSSLWGPGPLMTLAGGLAGFLILFVPAILSRGSMGWGDVKMAGMLGLMAGFPLVLLSLALGSISGGLFAAFLLLSRRRGRKDPMPFGPFLAFGTALSLVWGEPLFSSYLLLLAGLSR